MYDRWFSVMVLGLFLVANACLAEVVLKEDCECVASEKMQVDNVHISTSKPVAAQLEVDRPFNVSTIKSPQTSKIDDILRKHRGSKGGEIIYKATKAATLELNRGRKPMKLDGSVMARFKQRFPHLDLSKVRICEGCRLPDNWYIRGNKFRAITFGYTMYFKDSGLRNNKAGLHKILHELVHVDQFRRYGESELRWARQYGERFLRANNYYLYNSLEVEANMSVHMFFSNGSIPTATLVWWEEKDYQGTRHTKTLYGYNHGSCIKLVHNDAMKSLEFRAPMDWTLELYDTIKSSGMCDQGDDWAEVVFPIDPTVQVVRVPRIGKQGRFLVSPANCYRLHYRDGLAGKVSAIRTRGTSHPSIWPWDIETPPQTATLVWWERNNYEGARHTKTLYGHDNGVCIDLVHNDAMRSLEFRAPQGWKLELYDSPNCNTSMGEDWAEVFFPDNSTVQVVRVPKLGWRGPSQVWPAGCYVIHGEGLPGKVSAIKHFDHYDPPIDPPDIETPPQTATLVWWERNNYEGAHHTKTLYGHDNGVCIDLVHNDAMRSLEFRAPQGWKLELYDSPDCHKNDDWAEVFFPNNSTVQVVRVPKLGWRGPSQVSPAGCYVIHGDGLPGKVSAIKHFDHH